MIRSLAQMVEVPNTRPDARNTEKETPEPTDLPFRETSLSLSLSMYIYNIYTYKIYIYICMFSIYIYIHKQGMLGV